MLILILTLCYHTIIKRQGSIRRASVDQVSLVILSV